MLSNIRTKNDVLSCLMNIIKLSSNKVLDVTPAKAESFVIPAEAGIQILIDAWTPAFAGVTSSLASAGMTALNYLSLWVGSNYFRSHDYAKCNKTNNMSISFIPIKGVIMPPSP